MIHFPFLFNTKIPEIQSKEQKANSVRLTSEMQRQIVYFKSDSRFGPPV